MNSFFKATRGFLIWAAVVFGGFLWLQGSGLAAGGSAKEARVDPKEIRSTAPGSWTYIYWAHGSRGK